MSIRFIILRRESVGGYSTRGPVAQPVTLSEAQSEVVRLKKLFPYQDFVIMGEVGEVKRSDRVTVKFDAFDLSDVAPKKRRVRKVPEALVAPQTVQVPMVTEAPDSWNVFRLRKEESA
jgi:hypothetical protein